MNINWKKWGGVMGVVFLVAGCASSAHIEKDDNTDFTQYRTYAWIQERDGGKDHRKKSEDLTEQKIKSAVNAELQRSTGWKQVTDNPDVLLGYDILVERNVKEISNPVYTRPYSRLVYNPYTKRYITLYYPSQFVGYDTDQRPTREGTVTISMIDTRSNKMVFQGWTTDEVNSRNLTSTEIKDAVKSIFRKFDVAKN